ncbi:MAG: hypothetical protein RB191_15850 [Terriglobia bacterium]|nr:hypothetical protein [Terriglobia bacterium]
MNRRNNSQSGIVFLPVLIIIVVGSVLGWGIGKGLDAVTAPHAQVQAAPEKLNAE